MSQTGAPDEETDAEAQEQTPSRAEQIQERITSKLAEQLTSGPKQRGRVAMKIAEREEQKKLVRKMSAEVKLERRKVKRLCDKAKTLTDKDLTGILEVRENRRINMEENKKRRAEKAASSRN